MFTMPDSTSSIAATRTFMSIAVLIRTALGWVISVTDAFIHTYYGFYSSFCKYNKEYLNIIFESDYGYPSCHSLIGVPLSMLNKN